MYDIFKSVSTRIELPDGSKTDGKSINNEPEKYFTEDAYEAVRHSCTERILSMDNKIYKPYDNVIPHSLCDEIVEKFESLKKINGCLEQNIIPSKFPRNTFGTYGYIISNVKLLVKVF